MYNVDSKAKWIWYNGDFEIFHNLLLHSRREECGHYRPCFWSLASPYPRVNFEKTFTTPQDTHICVVTNGIGRVIVDEDNLSHSFSTGTEIFIPKGKHTVRVEITNTRGLPAIFVDSDYLKNRLFMVGKLWNRKKYTVR